MKNVNSLLTALIVLLSINVGAGQTITKETLGDLTYRHIGPMGNRIISVAGIPGDLNTYYVGSASGGIFKSVDGGFTWDPIFDDKPVHAIGALAIAPSDPATIYAGTGEAFIRSNVSLGDGMYKSTDSGETWTHIGLKESGRISRIVVHPTDPNIVYATAVGHAYSPQKTRGVYKTTDGGDTWTQVLFVDENTGASDLVMDPSNPRILFAGMWQLDLKTWKRDSGGPGSGVYMTKDAGKTWTKLTKGLPTTEIGKIALAMTTADPNRVYALIETGDGFPKDGKPTEHGELWRSDDKGKSWKMINNNRNLGGRQAYYTRCAAAPDNRDEIYFLAAAYSTSIDGGKTTTSPPFLQGPNWDHHEMWIDPTNPDRQIVVGDGGLAISHNRGKAWLRKRLPNAQLYHVTTDSEVPYNVLTNRQDGPSMKGPSRSNVKGFGNGIPNGMWHDIGGGESGFATPDPENPDIVWSSASGSGPLGGIVTRLNEKTGQVRQLEVWPEKTTGHAAKDVKYRFQWTFPLLISPHDRKTIYVTSQHVHKTTDDGNSWQEVSPDLTLNDKSMQQFSGGLTGDNINVEYGNVIYAFDESPVQEGVLWAGTNDGLVHVSKDGGANWENVTKNIPGLPKLGVVRNIDASKWDAGKAYLTIEFHQVGNFKPYVYKTDNYGKSWTKITNGIDDAILSYTRCIKEDPTRKGLLYLGTENKLYVSFDDGLNWQSMMGNLPTTPMYWIDIQEDFNDMVIGTYGRGIWILDDLSPIQQLSDKIQKEKLHVFKPNPTYRLRPGMMVMQFFPQPHWGTDPKYGAPISYHLSQKTDSVKIEILNTNGKLVRTIDGKGKAGINRTYWDLQTDKTEQIYRRTKPQYADYFDIGEKRKYKAATSPMSILVPPGDYTIKVTANGETKEEKLTVKKDPNSEGSLETIREQNELSQRIYDDMDEASKIINSIEKIKRQLYDQKELLSESKDMKDIVSDIKALDKKIVELEGKMMQLKATGTGQDNVRFGTMLIGRLKYLGEAISGTDFAPPTQHREVYGILHARLVDYKKQYNLIVNDDLKAYTKKLVSKGIGGTILP